MNYDLCIDGRLWFYHKQNKFMSIIPILVLVLTVKNAHRHIFFSCLFFSHIPNCMQTSKLCILYSHIFWALFNCNLIDSSLGLFRRWHEISFFLLCIVFKRKARLLKLIWFYWKLYDWIFWVQNNELFHWENEMSKRWPCHKTVTISLSLLDSFFSSLFLFTRFNVYLMRGWWMKTPLYVCANLAGCMVYYHHNHHHEPSVFEGFMMKLIKDY